MRSYRYVYIQYPVLQPTLKVGEGPHYVSESKEVHRVDDNQLLFSSPSRPARTRPAHQRTFLLTDYEPSRSHKYFYAGE